MAYGGEITLREVLLDVQRQVQSFYIGALGCLPAGEIHPRNAGRSLLVDIVYKSLEKLGV